MANAHTQFEALDLKVSEAPQAGIQTVTIINLDELIVVHQYRFVWQGQQDTPWSELNPPISQNCTESVLENCSAQGKYRVVGTIDSSLPDKKIQILFRKSGGPLKGAQSSIPSDKNPSHHYIPRGFGG